MAKGLQCSAETNSNNDAEELSGVYTLNRSLVYPTNRVVLTVHSENARWEHHTWQWTLFANVFLQRRATASFQVQFGSFPQYWQQDPRYMFLVREPHSWRTIRFCLENEADTFIHFEPN